MPALSVPSGTRSRRALRGLAAATALAVVPALGVANTATAQQGHRSTISQSSHDRQLTPRTHFTMKPDGSSGAHRGRRGDPEHRLGQEDHRDVLRGPRQRHRGQDVVAVHRRDERLVAVQDRQAARRPTTSAAAHGRSRRWSSTPTTPRCGRTTWKSRTCTSTSTRRAERLGARNRSSRRRRAWSAFVNKAADMGSPSSG